MNTVKLLNRPLLTGVCAVAALAGCSSAPIPREQLAVGQSSVEAAQSAGAGELAPAELNRAREKLALAQTAVRDKQLVAARRLAEEATADAQVARARANAERSRRAAQEIMNSLASLRQQLDNANDSRWMPTAPAAGKGNPPEPSDQDMPPPTSPREQPGTPNNNR